jgi:uncharacterized protein (DUF305 family)
MLKSSRFHARAFAVLLGCALGTLSTSCSDDNTSTDVAVGDARNDRPADAAASSSPDAGAAAPDTGGVGDGGSSVDGAPASGVAVRGDRRVPFTPNNDVEFVDFFVPHHQMAIDMAQMLIDRGADPELKAMANKMKADQTAEIGEMRTARLALTGSANSPAPPPDPTQSRHMAHMMTLGGADLDRMFMVDMIAHHASALPAAHRARPFLARADMRTLAQRIEDAQATEVGELKKMLGELMASDQVASAGHGSDGGVPGDAAAGGEDEMLVGDRRVPYTPPDDLGFTDYFIVHHEMAVMMAAMVVERGAGPEVKALATEIRTTQLDEIAEMKAARRALGASESPTPAPEEPIMMAEMKEMMMLSGAALDRRFLEEMIPHHAAGLPVALRGLPNLSRAELQEMGRNIYNSQAEEIGKMHELLEGEARDGGVD